MTTRHLMHYLELYQHGIKIAMRPNQAKITWVAPTYMRCTVKEKDHQWVYFNLELYQHGMQDHHETKQDGTYFYS